MKNIFLLRHGQSLANIDKSIYSVIPDHDVPLSPLGKLQAQAAATALNAALTLPSDTPLRIWQSPYRRTRQTADAIFKELSQRYPNLDKREHINLCEQQFGLFDGVGDEDISTFFPREHAHYELAAQNGGRFWPRTPMGESRFDVAVRVHQAFGTFHRDAEREGIENIIVVCHGVVLRAFVMQWRHLPYEWFEEEPNPGNCDIYHLGESHHHDRQFIYRTPERLLPEATPSSNTDAKDKPTSWHSNDPRMDKWIDIENKVRGEE